MSLDKLFAPLLDYLNFLVDFARFDNMQHYVFRGEINLFHLSNFLLACLFYWFITTNWGKFASKEKVDFLDWKFIIIIPLVLINAVLWQSGVYLVSLFTHFQVGTMKDSINVNFATASVLVPFLALNRKVLSATEGIQPRTVLQRLSVAAMSMLFLVVSLFSSVNFFRFAALYYQLNLAQLIWSIAAYIALAVVFGAAANQIFKLMRHKHSAG